MAETYRMKIAGLERELPLCPVNDKLDIAAFIIFGDVEMTVAACAELLAKCPAFDYILTPEAKGIPLAYELSRQSGKPYIIARKGAKLYMKNPVSVHVRSITTDSMQTLFLDEAEGERMRGKRVLILDDVISTGESSPPWRRCSQNLTRRSSARPPFSPKGTQQNGRISSSLRNCRSSLNKCFA